LYIQRFPEFCIGKGAVVGNGDFNMFLGYLLKHKCKKSSQRLTTIFAKDLFKDTDKENMPKFIADMCGRGGAMDTMAQLCSFSFNGTSPISRAFTVYHGPNGTKLDEDAARAVAVYYSNKAKRLLKLETTSDFNIRSSSCGILINYFTNYFMTNLND